MKQGIGLAASIALVCLSIEAPASAHGGRTNSAGCHNDRKNGGYHCHNGGGGGTYQLFKKSKKVKTKKKKRNGQPIYRLMGGSTYYSNCSAARAAGAAPIREGNPGYGRHLDRDGDGVACE